MVKGVSRRVVVVDSPDPQLFEQAIFILRNDAFDREGVTPEQVVSEACRTARSYTAAAAGGRSSRWRELSALTYTAMGAGAIGLLWLLASVL